MDFKEEDACRLHGESKMTVKEEELEGIGTYNTMKPVELMEYIARAADYKFSSEVDMPLVEKIEMTLDIILPHYGLK